MKNFIPVMRAKRLLEMKMYLDKGYTIQDKKHYLMLETIQLNYMGEEYEYGIQVTQDEIYFFINKDTGNIYLSIVEIYQMLYQMNNLDGGYFLNCLKKQLKQKRNVQVDFVNHGISYRMTKPVEIIKKAYIDIPQTGIQITNKELFLLILLIQEKSNALFRRSTGVKRTYANGIIRLLIVLLESRKNDSLLNELGWNWNNLQQKYEFVFKEERSGRIAFKYYLTQTEYSDIISNKKS